MTSSDLREALGVTPDPEFEMELPPGWSRRSVDDTALDSMQSGLKKRLMEAHQPQLYAELKTVLAQSFEQMRRNGAFAFFSGTEPDPGTLWVPASIVASIRRAEPGGTLDDLARTLIRSHGATPLRGDRGTLRFEREKTVRVAETSIVNQSVIYLIPVPGSKRRRALQLVASFGRTPDVSADHPSVRAMTLLFDSCVSTLRWHSGQQR